jgi:uncharacterized protein (DUF433 family)
MSEPEIVSTEDTLGGEPRIEGSRIGVSHVVQYYENEWGIEKISRELDLEPLEVVKALEYYYRNPQEIRGIIRDWKGRSAALEIKTTSV